MWSPNTSTRKKSLEFPQFLCIPFYNKNPKHYHRFKKTTGLCYINPVTISWQRLCQDLRSTPKKYIFWYTNLSRLAISQTYPSVPRKGRPRWQLIHLSRAQQKHRLGSLELLLHQQVDPGGFWRIFVWWIFRLYLDNWCCQWLFLVPPMGGRWHIITQLAYLPLLYHFYTYSGNQKQLQYWCWLSLIFPFWIHVFCWEKNTEKTIRFLKSETGQKKRWSLISDVMGRRRSLKPIMLQWCLVAHCQDALKETSVKILQKSTLDMSKNDVWKYVLSMVKFVGQMHYTYVEKGPLFLWFFFNLPQPTWKLLGLKAHACRGTKRIKAA